MSAALTGSQDLAFRTLAHGTEAMAAEFGPEDAQLRAGASTDDPDQGWVFEETRQGLEGWMDDEIANTNPWGFAIDFVPCPTSIWYDPNDTTLPPQHAAWLATHIDGAELIVTHALGHGSPDDPRADWRRLYRWLADPAGGGRSRDITLSDTSVC